MGERLMPCSSRLPLGGVLARILTQRGKLSPRFQSSSTGSPSLPALGGLASISSPITSSPGARRKVGVELAPTKKMEPPWNSLTRMVFFESRERADRMSRESRGVASTIGVNLVLEYFFAASSCGYI